MQVPVILRFILPTGLMGAMCAVVLAAFISTHDTYLHSWGVIFIQDVIMPFRKKPFSPEQHVSVLRWSICGVAVFIFFFSMWFPIKEYLRLWVAITGAIFMGGSGSAIIGGLYWKRGSTAGAFSGLTTGAVLAITGIIIRQINPDFTNSNVRKRTNTSYITHRYLNAVWSITAPQWSQRYPYSLGHRSVGPDQFHNYFAKSRGFVSTHIFFGWRLYVA